MNRPLTVADTGLSAVIVPRTPRATGTAAPIDLAYAEINALGGYVDSNDREAVSRDELLGEVLAILERHGAVDPDLASHNPDQQQAAA